MQRQGGESGTLSADRERHLAAAQEITHIGSWEWDLATHVVTWSDELYRIYGLEPRSLDITLDVFLSFLEPEDRTRIQGEIARALEHGGRFTYVERIVRPDGSRRSLDTVGNVIPGPDGRPRGVIGTCRDVTDERKRDEAIRLYADIVHNTQIGISVWHVDDPDHAETARLIAFNPAAETLTRIPLSTLVGEVLSVGFPMIAGTELMDVIAHVARERCVRELATYRFTGTGTQPRDFSVRAFPLPGRSVGVALEDVTAQTRARELRDDQQRVLEMLAAGAPLDDVLRALILAIERQVPGTLGSVLLLDESGTRIHHCAGPNLPVEYMRALDGSEVGPRAGSCGTSVYRRAAVFVSDIETDPLWDGYRELARRFGLRACWSMPIAVTDGRIVGTFALYYREPRTPTDEDVALIARATHVAGVAIQRHELDERLRALSVHVEAVQEEERTSVAREIHDALGQALTALKIDVAWVTRRVGDDATRPAALERLASMSSAIDGIIDDVRRISAGLRPGMLDELGLVAAIEWKTEDFEQRIGTPCTFRTNLSDERLPRDFSTAVFRMVQEALTNVVRHAEATHVDVSLMRVGDRLRVEVRDDGKGISPEAAVRSSSLGLLGARERARRFGGDVTIARQPEGGTSFVIDVPFPGAIR